MKIKFLLAIGLLLLLTNSFAGSWNGENIAGLSTKLYVPETAPKINNKRALMISLHGCAQSADDIMRAGNWGQAANEFGMVVAIPQVPNGGVYFSCWDYYGMNHDYTNRHNVYLLNLVDALLQRKELNIDSNQVYISGLSSGGGQAALLSCLAPHVFAGAGLAASPSPGTEANDISFPKVNVERVVNTCKTFAGDKASEFNSQVYSVFYGTSDYLVNNKYGEINATAMATLYGADKVQEGDLSKLDGPNTNGTLKTFSDSKGPRVSIIANQGVGHTWPAGKRGSNGTYVSGNTVNYPLYLTSFLFENNRRANRAAVPSISSFEVKANEESVAIQAKSKIENAKIIKAIVKIYDRLTNEIIFEKDYTKSAIKFSKKLTDGQYVVSVKFVSNLKTVVTAEKIFAIGKEVNKPAEVNVKSISVENSCVVVGGEALNEQTKSVKVSVDGKEVFNTDLENGKYRVKVCKLVLGPHKVTVTPVNFNDELGLSITKDIEIKLDSVNDTLTGHMMAGRLSWNNYNAWFSKYGLNKFTLYRVGEDEWTDEI